MYKEIKIGDQLVAVMRLSDKIMIPLVVENTDYFSYLKWLDGYELQGREWVKTSEGNQPLPADA